MRTVPKIHKNHPQDELFASQFSLCLVKGQKSAWRKDLPALAQFGRKMRGISCNEAFRLPGNGCLKEGFVVRIRKRVTEW
jgi:hypothetical protein